MKKVLFLLIAISISTVSFSQIDLKGSLNRVKQDAIQKTKDAGEKKMDDSRKEYDESNFNYAISFSDNAGLFETKEKSDRLKNTMIEGYKVGTNKDDNDLMS